jgi:molecular chaperone DnaK (HSP70)
MADSRDTVVVGFDLGHGETAVTFARAEKETPPNVLDLGGEAGRQHVTAVAEHPQRGVLVGVEAAEAFGVSSFYLAFKAPQLTRDDVRRPVKLFVERIHDDVVGRAMLPKASHTRWVFGAPSGWSRELRGEYAQLLRGANLSEVEVTPESRAALLYARESGDVQVDGRKLGGAVLIVDIGSSTTDFTVVVGHKDRPVDTGNELGASLLDKEILRRVLEAHPQRELLEDALQTDRFERLRLELTSRRAKEAFFRTDPSRFAANPDATVGTIRKVPTRQGNVFVEVELSAQDMESVIDAPQPRLGGRSWRAAFHEALVEIVQDAERPPDLVLLTGGASRMAFVLAVAREVFGSDRVMLGSEPEVAIARGLALAGRMSVRAAGFRRDIDQLLESGTIDSLVNERLPALAERIGEAATRGITERHVIPAFRRWRNNQITTLNQMIEEITSAVRAELAAPDNPELLSSIAAWQNDLRPELEELTRPICLRWHIPPAAMELPTIDVRGNQLHVSVETSAATDVMDNLAEVGTVVVAGVVATTLFGAGTALVATTGPVAVVVAFVVALGIALGLKEEMMDKAQEANIPPWLRKVKGEQKLVAKLREEAPAREAELSGQLAQQFLQGGGPVLVHELSRSLANELNALADEAELLIT